MTIDNYDVGQLIGKGAYASVHYGRNRTTDQKVAIKFMHNNNNKIDIKSMIQREKEVHSSLLHTNIVQLLDWFEIPNMFVLVTQYCSFGDLHTYIKSIKVKSTSAIGDTSSTLITEDEIRHILKQILQGIEYLHDRGIVHRDIKASNIFLYPTKNYHEEEKHNSSLFLLSCNVKIGDFGLSVQMQEDDDWDEGRYTLCGTPSCLAPEVVMSNPTTSNKNQFSILSPSSTTNDNIIEEEQKKEQPFSPSSNYNCIMNCQGHGRPADLWSTGRYPFYPSKPTPQQQQHNREQKLSEIIIKILNGNWSLPTNIIISNDIKLLLYQLLSLDPRQRKTATDILCHSPFFVSNDKNNNVCSNNEQQKQQLEQKPIEMKYDDDDDILSSIQSMNIELKNQNLSLEKEQQKIQTYLDESRKKSLSSSFDDTFFFSIQKINKDKYQYNRGNHHHHPIISSKQNNSNRNNNDPLMQHDYSILLQPLQSLNRLPMTRRQWTEDDEIYKKKYSFFMLPFGLGAVLHYEKNKFNNDNNNGIWMHLAGDGLRVAISHQERNTLLSSFTIDPDTGFDNSNEDDYNNAKATNIIQEAFRCAPITIQSYINTTFQNNSTSNDIDNNNIKRISNVYHPLSSLNRHKSIITLYKKLYEIVITLKQDTPKIVLSLTSNDNDDIIGKAMMMENEPFPDVLITFQKEMMEVSFIRYQMSTGIMTMQHFNNEINDVIIQIQGANNIDCAATTTNGNNGSNMIKYEYYMNIALIVLREFMNIEQEEQQQSSSVLLDDNFLANNNINRSLLLLKNFQGIRTINDAKFPVCRETSIPVS